MDGSCQSYSQKVTGHKNYVFTDSLIISETEFAKLISSDNNEYKYLTECIKEIQTQEINVRKIDKRQKGSRVHDVINT